MDSHEPTSTVTRIPINCQPKPKISNHLPGFETMYVQYTKVPLTAYGPNLTTHCIWLYSNSYCVPFKSPLQRFNRRRYKTWPISRNLSSTLSLFYHLVLDNSTCFLPRLFVHWSENDSTNTGACPKLSCTLFIVNRLISSIEDLVLGYAFGTS